MQVIPDANRNDGSEQCDNFLGPVTDKVELGDHRLREIWSVIIPTGTPRLNKWIYIPYQENLFPILFSPQPSFQTLPPGWLDTLCGLTWSRSRIWPRVGGSRLGCRWWARMGRNSPRLNTFSGMKKSHTCILSIKLGHWPPPQLVNIYRAQLSRITPTRNPALGEVSSSERRRLEGKISIINRDNCMLREYRWTLKVHCEMGHWLH